MTRSRTYTACAATRYTAAAYRNTGDCPPALKLAGYVAGALQPNENAAVRIHLQGCLACALAALQLQRDRKQRRL